MASDGPGPEQGPGPSSSEREAARRRLYAPGGASAEDAERYARLSAPAAPGGDLQREGRPDEEAAVSAAAPARRHGVRTAVLAAASVLLVAGGVLGVGLLLRPGPPARLPIPSLAGDTIAAYGRARDASVGPAEVTYQPEGYSVFQPAGRVVHVSLRCSGEGTVRLAAGSVQSFTCGDDQRTFVRSDGVHRSDPFMVGARTTGDVVWSVRVTLRDR